MSNENIYIHKYLSFSNKPLNFNDSLIIKEKMRILDLLSKDVGKNITSLDTLFIASDCNFGNSIAILNKLLFYCEINLDKKGKKLENAYFRPKYEVLLSIFLKN